jgi:hypothetical protein
VGRMTAFQHHLVGQVVLPWQGPFVRWRAVALQCCNAHVGPRHGRKWPPHCLPTVGLGVGAPPVTLRA